MKIKRTFDILESGLKNFPLDVALASKVNGKWKSYSTKEYKEIVDQVSAGLISLGIKKGDKIATVTNNRPEWNFINYGVAQIGAVLCPIYPTISESDYKFIFKDAGIKYAFLSDADLYGKIDAIRSDVPSLEKVFSFDVIQGVSHWKEILSKESAAEIEDTLIKIKEEISEEDLVTIIYTSGTTGNPKGVMLSHKNLVSNALEGVGYLPVQYGDKALSFLPLCHVFERSLLNIYTLGGISIYYAESIETIGDNIKEIKPHIFTAVPRLIEKVYDKVIAGGNQKSGIIKHLFLWAVKKAQAFEIGQSKSIGDLIAEKLVFSKIRLGLGGNVKTIVSGSAALQTRLTRFFWGIGIPILEGYGLTETSPIVSVNTLEPEGTKFGTIGKVINDVTVKIAEDGEILVKGPNVMMGYYSNPEKTAEVMTGEWFHTGDIGIFDGDYLKITDRKKEIFKTSGGKYVAPQPMENKMKESMFIEQIMVIGEARKHPAALIVPNFVHVKSWCEHKGYPCGTNEEIICMDEVKKKISSEIDSLNVNFGKVEQIKKFELLPKEWCVQDGELTPTMKLKRKVIKEKCADLFVKIYGE
ncbi:MAG: long-chain acyl-CoA synthetase [Saprospiraceae bacterium]|jgi:long-chain acyl-CoA synthetase